MKCCCRSSIAVVLLVGVLTAGSPAEAQGNSFDRSNANSNQYLLRSTSPASLDQITAQYDLSVVAELEHLSGQLLLVEGPESMAPAQMEALVQQDANVGGFESAALASLPGISDGVTLNPQESDVLPDLIQSGTFSSPCLSQHVAEALWKGYADQQALSLIQLHPAQAASADCGTATVAILDTGIDPEHPLLSDALVPGYDFLIDEEGTPSEWDLLDQSVRAIVEQSVRAIVEYSVTATTAGVAELSIRDSSIAPLLDQSVRAIVEEQPLPQAFGHGTMVAGLVRVVAPAAKIMPLRVFDDQGAAHLFDIVRAIYWAVDHGANVINMSFSMEASSKELKEAVQYARKHGVTCVAAAGNQGENTLVYPAAYGASMGIASSTLTDELSDFSNRGAQLVELAAPGHGLISLYPGGLYAAGWGTSFSTPLVAGAAALLHASSTDPDISAVQYKTNALKQGSTQLLDLSGEIQSGRLDVLGALTIAQE